MAVQHRLVQGRTGVKHVPILNSLRQRSRDEVSWVGRAREHLGVEPQGFDDVIVGGLAVVVAVVEDGRVLAAHRCFLGGRLGWQVLIYQA